MKIVLANKNDTCHFHPVPEPDLPSIQHRVGRPKRGTQIARQEVLLGAATRVFLRDGYGAASIEKVAAAAGVSTRTIYARYTNKADLLGAVLGRLVERDLSFFGTAELERLEPRVALSLIGKALTGRACNPDSIALLRILASEAARFPELAARMRATGKCQVGGAIHRYFQRQEDKGVFRLADPQRAAVLFLHMICAELHECLLFGSPEEMAAFDVDLHLETVIDIFLNGAIPHDGQTPITDALPYEL